jgi:hypothetical protein
VKSLPNSVILFLILGEDQNDFEYAEKQEDSNEYSEIQPVVSIEEFDNQELITKGKFTYPILTGFVLFKFILTKLLLLLP